MLSVVGAVNARLPLVPEGTILCDIIPFPVSVMPTKNKPIQSEAEWLLGATQLTVIAPPGAMVVGVALKE